MESQDRKKRGRRSDCPISFSLDSFGDLWSLLLVRDIVYFGKKTFGEFRESDESIATNILASRLTQLQDGGILEKLPHPTDKRKDVFALTDAGLDLIPIVLDLAVWGARHDAQTGAPMEWIAYVSQNREAVAARIRETVCRGGSVFVGENSLVQSLGLKLG